MAPILQASSLLLSLFTSTAAAWTETQYLSPFSDRVMGTTSSMPVYPTGSVSVTSSTVITTKQTARFGFRAITADLTLTRMYMPTGSAPVCSQIFGCLSTETTGSITTNIFAPVTIANDPTCTLTSYSYVTSSSGTLGNAFLSNAGLENTFPSMFRQATETGDGKPALFVTTYVSTISTNLGGQAVTTTRCDVFLKPDQITGVTPIATESALVSQCVDPRRFLCPAPTTTSRGFQPTSTGTCGTDWIGEYGKGQAAVTNTGPAGPGSTGQGKPNAASGLRVGADTWRTILAIFTLCIGGAFL